VNRSRLYLELTKPWILVMVLVITVLEFLLGRSSAQYEQAARKSKFASVSVQNPITSSYIGASTTCWATIAKLIPQNPQSLAD